MFTLSAPLPYFCVSMWDGITTSDESKVIVIGCTNRPDDLDPAVLRCPNWLLVLLSFNSTARRFGRSFEVGLPDVNQRQHILGLVPQFFIVLLRYIYICGTQVLADEHVSEGLLSAVAVSTRGYSGSDLRELCKAACAAVVHDFYLQQEKYRSGQTVCSRSLSSHALY